MRSLKTLLFAFGAVIMLSGCATTEQLNALEARVSALESASGGTSSSDSDAVATARQAARDASAAKATAERAMDAANEANERAARVADTCCSRK